MNEERIIGFDEEVSASTYVELDEGIYQFEYCGYTTGNTNPQNGGQSFPTGIAKLKAKNIANGQEIEVTETFIMSSKWMWKLSNFWKSLGAQEHQSPTGEKTVPQGWKTMVGQRGYFEAVKSPSKDGTKTYTNKNFIAPADVQTTVDKWKLNHPQAAVYQPAPAPQPQSNSWGSQGW